MMNKLPLKHLFICFIAPLIGAILFSWYSAFGTDLYHSQIPHKRMLDDPLQFTGPDSLKMKLDELDEIRIGFFAPKSHHPVGQAMWQGALLAVEQINDKGGIHGIPISLIQRWADEPWGAGSKEVIRLVYEDKVWAVIGSIDGDTTHIAEQIVTKVHVPLLAPVSSDPTLTHIRIPWIFRLPPDDASQAKVLIDEMIEHRSFKRIGIITTTDHDGRIATYEFEQTLKQKQCPPLFHFYIPPTFESGRDTITQIIGQKPDAFLMRVTLNSLQGILKEFQHAKLDIPVFIPWIPGIDMNNVQNIWNHDLIMVEPFCLDINRKLYQDFRKHYLGRYKEPPSFCAGYAYDAVNLIAESFRKSGPSRLGLRKALAEQSGYKGVTGAIKWDNGGGNTTPPCPIKCE